MLTRALAAAVRRLELRGRRVLVAVSGGIDSVALAHGLHALAQRHGVKLLIGHVNHGLRGAESDADEASVEALAAALGIPSRSARVDPKAARAAGPSRDRPTLQEAARSLRYAALSAIAEAEGAECIATAHTVDDQAETLLLRVLRGCGPDGLAGIPERSRDGRIVRPLLGITRAEIERYAAEQGLAWREDASNASREYARNRLRHDWLPGLARAFNPRLLRALAGLAEAQRRDSDWIGSVVDREVRDRFGMEGGWLWIDTDGWRDLPEALSRRLSHRALERCGAGRLASRRHLERMDAFLRGEALPRTLELPGELRLLRDRSGVRLGPERRSAHAGPRPRMLSSGAPVGFPPQEAR